MFDDFSLASPLRQDIYYDCFADNDVISPAPSRAAILSYGHRCSEDNPLSMADLACRFEQQSLRSAAEHPLPDNCQSSSHERKPTIRFIPPSPQLIQKSSVRRLPYSINRKQSTPAHLSRISTLVHGILQDGGSCLSIHPSSLNNVPSSISLHDHTPLSHFSTYTSAPSPFGAEDNEFDSNVIPERQCVSNVSKEMRQIVPREAYIRQALVKKNVRMRRAARRKLVGKTNWCAR
ncbi:hypothetical protein MMC12_001325 [Toensbergia leucococca]|nr:hypothetical protein [Toensbergia leucococca]